MIAGVLFAVRVLFVVKLIVVLVRLVAVFRDLFVVNPGGVVIRVFETFAGAQRARLFNGNVPHDMEHAALIDQVALLGAVVPDHLQRVDAVD